VALPWGGAQTRMAGKTDFIINGSFERQAGGDAAAWIDVSPQFDPVGDGHTFQFRAALPPDGPPDSWSVTRGFFGLETEVAHAARAAWDGKVWGLAHDGTIAQQVTGLTAGVVYDLALVAYHPEWPVPSGLQVFWNGREVADFGALTEDPGHMTHVLVTAGAGTNQLELRTTSVVIVDDVRLFAAGPGETVDFSQSSQPLGVNLGDVVFRTQFPGVPTLPSLPAMHAFVGGVPQALNGITNLIGGSANDLLVGASQGGTIDARAGNDVVVGGAGDDTLNGGTGDDLVVGGDGVNYLRGDDGDDYIQGGSGFDDINGTMGNDTCVSGGGDDWVVGGKGNDSLVGSDGQNLVYGNIGADTCDGGAGDDIVRGGQDNDVVLGGAGNDFVSGDRGDDTVTGGAGADIFHTFGDAGIDRVTDFSLAQGDRVQVDPGTIFTVSQVGADTVITMTGGGEMILVGVQMSTLTPGWIFGA
jgi:Ca2+-binding RTX toxin-like protein